MSTCIIVLNSPSSYTDSMTQPSVTVRVKMKIDGGRTLD